MTGTDLEESGSGNQDFTHEEFSNLSRALKEPKFREYFQEYVDDISDPKHRKEYETYLEELENRGEIPAGRCLLRADPGLCVKTKIRFKSGQTQKLFLNICQSTEMGDFSISPYDPSAQKQRQEVKLPLSVGPPRPDKDSHGVNCLTSDIAISCVSFKKCQENLNILKFLIDTICDNLTESFFKGNEEVLKDYKILTKTKCKGGKPMPMSVTVDKIKSPSTSVSSSTSSVDGKASIVTPGELNHMKKQAMKEEAARKDAEAAAAAAADAAEAQTRIPQDDIAPIDGIIRQPLYRIVEIGHVDFGDFMESDTQKSSPVPHWNIPKNLRIVVELPWVTSAKEVEIDLSKERLKVEIPQRYFLDIPLPYAVKEDSASAKFDKKGNPPVLSLTMDVISRLSKFATTNAPPTVDAEGEA